MPNSYSPKWGMEYAGASARINLCSLNAEQMEQVGRRAERFVRRNLQGWIGESERRNNRRHNPNSHRKLTRSWGRGILLKDDRRIVVGGIISELKQLWKLKRRYRADQQRGH